MTSHFATHTGAAMPGEPAAEDRLVIVDAFDRATIFSHTVSRSKGWWEQERNLGEIIALIHSELSEALEALRDGNPPSEKIPGFSQLEEELADVLHRVFDLAGHLGLDLGHAYLAKARYNMNRPHKHGGRRF